MFRGKTKYKIILAGAGQIGSRHLQGLMTMPLSAEIAVVEPATENRKVAEQRMNQVKRNNLIEKIHFLEKSEDIPFKEADLVIIATNSDVRPETVSKIISGVKVKFMILEKVAYQSDKIFGEQIGLLEDNRIKAWINCPRRIYPFYLDLKEELKGYEKIKMTVSGSNWGLGCNSVHFIDLFGFLRGKRDLHLRSSNLDLKILESKRNGFSEFTGEISYSSGDDLLILNSSSSGNQSRILEVSTETKHWTISELSGEVTIADSKNLSGKTTNVRFPFQSELSGIIATDILEKGDCGLTGIIESAQYHSLMFQPVIQHIGAVTGIFPEYCPIT